MKHLTGRYRFRNEDKLLVLQVEEETYEPSPYGGDASLTYRDATTEDLLEVRFSDEKCRYISEPAQAGLAPLRLNHGLRQREDA